jgi:hypothetical protein
MPLTLSYDNPVTAVFLRILAWELYVAIEQLRVQDVVTQQVQTARRELGLAPLEGGAAHDFIQKLRLMPEPLLSAKNTPPAPLQKKWQTEWRLLYLPTHNVVRQLSKSPIFTVVQPSAGTHNYKELLLTLRNPTLPSLRVFVGVEQPKVGTFKQQRGLYFLGRQVSPRKTKLYLGKTDEFDVRLPQHIKNKAPTWWVFITPEDDAQTFTLDALAAAEALLISFWNETSLLDNGQRGSDQKPAFMYLQQAILLVEAASATLLWLIREQLKLDLPQLTKPFKAWGGKGWPDCYTSVP